LGRQPVHYYLDGVEVAGAGTPDPTAVPPGAHTFSAVVNRSNATPFVARSDFESEPDLPYLRKLAASAEYGADLRQQLLRMLDEAAAKIQEGNTPAARAAIHGLIVRLENTAHNGP